MNALIKMTVTLKAEMFLLEILNSFRRTSFFNIHQFTLKLLYACFLGVLLITNLQAQTTYTWKTSPVDNNWTNGSNWTKSGTTTSNTYPGLTSTDIVAIASGSPTISSGSYTIARLSVNNTSATVQGNLTINNNATLSINGTGTTTTPTVSIAGGIITNNGTLSISTTATGAGFGIIFNDAPDKTIATKYDGTGTLNINTSAGNMSSGAVLFNNTTTTAIAPNLLFNGTTNFTLKQGAYALVTTTGNVNAVVGGNGFSIGTIASPVSNGLINQAGGGSSLTINTGTTLTCVGASSNTTNGVQIAPSTGNANFVNKGTINVSGTYNSGIRLTNASTSTNTFNNQGAINADITSPTTFAGAFHVAGNVASTNFSISNSGTMSLNNNRFGSNTSTGYAVFIGNTNTPNVAITNSGTFSATGTTTFLGGTLNTTTFTNTATGVLNTNYELDKMAITNSGTINFVNTGSSPSTSSNAVLSSATINNSGTINTNAGINGYLTKVNGLVTTASSVLNPGGNAGYGIIDINSAGTATMLGTLQIQVVGSIGAGIDYDQLKNTGGTFSLSGLNLNITGSLFIPTTNYAPITIISASAGTITSTLSSVTGLSSGWSVKYNTTSVQLVYAQSTYYVSPSGNDNNVGSIDFPFLTIQKAFNTAVAGNTINLRAGTYRESVNISTHNITLQAYNNEEVILSGTDVYNNLIWTPSVGNSAIYAAPYTGAAFEQLFFNNKPMIQARWPNLPKDANGDWNYWDTTMWADASKGAVYGTMVDSALSTTGFSALGAWAVLNVNHQYYTWTRPVLSHTMGSPSFTYSQDLGTSIKSALSYTDDRYYLVGKLDLLDAPGEWFYDTIANLIYFYPPNGLNPNTLGIEIKNRNFALTATSDTNLTIQNLTFWATAFKFNSMTSGCNNLVFKNNTVRYSSSTEFFSVNAGQYGDSFEDNFPVIYGNKCTVIGNTFADGALSALLISGFDNVIENNIVHDFNYTSSLVTPLFQVSRTWDAFIGYAGRATVRYNDFYNSGGVVFSIGQSYNDVNNNHFYNAFLSCSGGNKDHSMVYTNCQTNSSASMGTRFHHNWMHDGYCGSTKTDWGGGTGIRGDDTTTGVTMDHLVTWNLGSVGINMKSPVPQTSNQANFVLNNTSFNNSRNNTENSSIIIETTGLNSNKFSSVYNNAGLGTYGGWFATAIQYLTAKGNNYDTSSKVLLEDTASYDFRPLSGSVMINNGTAISGITTDVTDGLPDIGAYERGLTTYWIPGFRDSKTSFPIIPDGSTCVSITRDQLMWKPAYNSVSNKIYFGTSTGSLALQSATTVEQNVFALPTLSNGITYYWRVDGVMSDNSVVTGTVWSFTTKNAIALSSVVGSNAQTVCINTAIANITYSVGNATGVNFSGLPTGVTGLLSGNTVTISGTPTVAGSFSYTMNLTSNCGTLTTNGTITITANNTITRTSTVATTTQTLCINTAITNITYSTVRATGANCTGLPTGVSGVWSNNVVTISGTPTVAGSFPYMVTLTGGCGTITASGTITVNATNTITLSSITGTDAQEPCTNTPITNITYTTTGSTGATFSNLQGGIAGSRSGNTITISGSTSVTSNRTYTVTLTGGCGTVTTTGTINTLNSTISRTSTAATTSQTVCINTAITNITYSTTKATGAVVSGLPTGVTGDWSNGVVTISGSPTVTGTYPYTVTLTGGCGNNTATGSITVNLNTITLTSAIGTDAQEPCINTPITNITYSTTGSTGATFSNLQGGLAGSRSGNILTISGSTTVTSNRTYTVTLTGGCGTVTATGTINTNNNSITRTSAAATTAQVITYGETITNISYSTIKATGAIFSGLPNGVNGAWSGNVVTISGTPTASGTFNYTVTLTGGCGNITTSGSITINKATPTLSVSGTQSFTYSGIPQGPATTNYNGDGTTSLLYTNTTGAAYSSTTPPTNAGSYQVVATASAGTNYLSVSSNAYTFTINKSLVQIKAANQTVSYGTNVATVVSNGTFSAFGFVNGETASVVSGSISYTTNYTTATAPNSAGITISPTIAGLSATNYSFVAVDGLITISCGSISATLSGSATVCAGVNTTISININGGASPYSVVYSNGLENTSLNNYASNALIAVLPTVTANYILVSLTDANGCLVPSLSGTAIITVNTPSVAATSVTASVNNLCLGSSTTLTQSGGTLGTSAIWKWYSDAAFTNLVGSSSSTNASLTVTPSATTTYYVRAEGAASPCVSVSSNNAYSVTVNMATTNTWTGATNTAWNVPNNWCSGSVPANGTDVIIANSINQPILNSNTTVGAFNLANGTTLSLANNTLTINGAISGTGLIIGSPTSNIVCNGSSNGAIYFSAATKDTTNVLNNLTINTSGTVVLGNNLSLKGALFPMAGNLNTGGNLTLLSDSNGTARVDKVLGNISGNVTVQRYITAKTARKYSFVGSSVSGSTIKNSWQQQIYISGSGSGGVVCGSTNGLGGSTDKYNSNGFDVTPTNRASMYMYAASPVNGTRWTGIANTNNTNLIPGKGYRVNIRGDRNSANTNCSNQLTGNVPMAPEAVTLSASGVLTTGDLSVSLNDTSVHKYSFLSNPYPSQMSFTALQSGNPIIDNVMWTYSPFGNGNYATYSWGIVANAAKGYDNTSGEVIASGQAFFVKANANGSIVFKEAYKTNTNLPNTQYFGTVNRQLIRIKLLSASQSPLDEVVARFNANGSNTYQSSFDAESMNIGNEALAILKGNNRLAIGSFSDNKLFDTIRLSLGNNSVGSYSLFFSDLETLDSACNVVLIDQYLNQREAIVVSSNYSFAITGDSLSRGNNRFLLILKRNSMLLPVHLNYFTAEMNGATNLLHWQNKPSNNIRSFYIERSVDKNSWQSIGVITVQENKADYTFTDSVPQKVAYYRLRQIERSGSVSFSTIRSVKRTENLAIELFPNPTNEKIWIKLPATFFNDPSFNCQLNMYNALGQKIYTQKLTCKLQEISIVTFAKGWYWVEVKVGEKTRKEKLLIQ